MITKRKIPQATPNTPHFYDISSLSPFLLLSLSHCQPGLQISCCFPPAPSIQLIQQPPPPPPPHKHTVTERDCHLKVNFLSLSYHLLCCNTGGSTAMWTISTSTNTHCTAITHSRCRDQVSPKNQAYSLHLHESHCPGITCALQVPTLIMNCNCTLFFYMRYHILKRKKNVALIM